MAAHPPDTRPDYRDPSYLYQVIEAIGAGPDLVSILRRIVSLVTEATRCHACFIYFVHDGQLTLRAASRIYAHLEGQVSFPVGSGLTGWVAKTRQSAVIRDKALEDPRVNYVPELEEEQFQSLVSVPIFARNSELIGVITLHAEAPHEFGRPDLEFVEHTAALVAGAVENATLYDQATARVELLTQLSELAQAVASSPGLDELLPMIADRTRSLLRATSSEVYLFDSAERLILHASSPARSQARPLEAKHVWFRLIDAGRPGAKEAHALAEALWGEGVSGTPLFAPLLVGDERLGVLCVLTADGPGDAPSVLAAIASQAAVAIKRLQLIDWLKEKNLVKDFFEALQRENPESDDLRAQAARLRCDLGARQVVMHAVPWTAGPAPTGRRVARQPAEAPPDWRQVAMRMESRLRAELPSAIFDRREGSVRALLRLPADDVDIAGLVRRAYELSGGTATGPLAIGISNIGQGASSFARGFEEAASAAQVGALLRGTSGVFSYEDLGPYRYVLNADQMVRDRYQDGLERLVAYERRRGTELLGTLEAYLEHQGNIAQTARKLYMHPNTLRQRLVRIERVAGLDLDKEDWLSLAMAVKAVKLRSMRTAAAAERRDTHGGGD
ncbi:MAG TPA: GAF domain-containing protein [Candidatus Dormibacteraeota bacterium]|nr:GAF domain-containing protein [Candidatus Dormibacteraeota bacterium]